jgi:hypothetical protein
VCDPVVAGERLLTHEERHIAPRAPERGTEEDADSARAEDCVSQHGATLSPRWPSGAFVRKCRVVVEETTDSAVAFPEEDEAEESISELLEQLGRDLAALVFYEGRLVASRNKRQLRQAGLGAVAALAVAAALLTAFVLANTAALLGLATVMDGWLAALVLAAAWTAVAALLAFALWLRAKRAVGEEGETVEQARERAEQAVRATLERLAPALTKEIALAAVPTADGVVDLGEDLIEDAEELVEDIVEDLPGGGVVNQVWDVVLAPGRLGIRVATTVLRRGEPGG